MHVLASILAWASSVINPFIYAFSNRQYRSAYRQLLCGSSSRGRSTTSGYGGRGATSANTATHSRSSGGRTFLTEMLHYTTNADKVKVIRNSPPTTTTAGTVNEPTAERV